MSHSHSAPLSLDGALNLADSWHLLFKLLGDRTRLRLLVALHHGGPSQRTVQELADVTETRVVTASAALNLMANAGLIQAERHGREMRYSLVDPQVHQVLHDIGALHGH
ncbi:ArsR/SmtB family transcription factor [Corynebacterium suicordis]|uniref:Winged helix-turn-helix transcriptional regulator n=1 Tax=Corynebacterium suicordis DSM 45110 TaxID=1121369 RepID=A0ABR9ZH66_9CORY|nr:metalloregulator ArsR/SmtB family transcription factor [Corynebacterium suicordis]MBF4552763.1 winged helix-turn-helix transcriptional regulator [Corynebacterium suicordis DSM 45110]MDR6278278.1 DNA-binding transcriptional ArsR family regulator [Corynebacterium suicordis]